MRKLGRQFVKPRSRSGSSWRDQPGFIGQGLPSQRLTRSKWVIGPAQNGKSVIAQMLEPPALRDDLRTPANHQIDLSARDRKQLVISLALDQMDRDLRVQLSKTRQRIHEQTVHCAHRSDDPDGTPSAMLSSRDNLSALLDAEQKLLRDGQQVLASACGTHTTRVPLEKPRLQ